MGQAVYQGEQHDGRDGFRLFPQRPRVARRRTWPGRRAFDLALRGTHRFRRFVLLLLPVPVIVTDPATLPHLVTTLLRHALPRWPGFGPVALDEDQSPRLPPHRQRHAGTWREGAACPPRVRAGSCRSRSRRPGFAGSTEGGVSMPNIESTGQKPRSDAWKSAITVVQEAEPPHIPEGAHAMTIVVEFPPGDPGTPPHRHAGPAFGYVLDGEMVFELEGQSPRVVPAGEAFWEPGGDVIHYRTATIATTSRCASSSPCSANPANRCSPLSTRTS